MGFGLSSFVPKKPSIINVLHPQTYVYDLLGKDTKSKISTTVVNTTAPVIKPVVDVAKPVIDVGEKVGKKVGDIGAKVLNLGENFLDALNDILSGDTLKWVIIGGVAILVLKK